MRYIPLPLFKKKKKRDNLHIAFHKIKKKKKILEMAFQTSSFFFFFFFQYFENFS